MTQQNNSKVPYMPAYENINTNMPANTGKSLVEETKKHRALYPEIHYKLSPFITATCEAIQASGRMPNQKELDDITDNIYDEFCTMHPEMANYMKTTQKDDPPEAVPTFDGYGGYDDYDGYGGYGGYSGYGPGPGYGGYRRRGLARDLIGGLLIAALLGRGMSYNPYPYSPYSYNSYPY